MLGRGLQSGRPDDPPGMRRLSRPGCGRLPRANRSAPVFKHKNIVMAVAFSPDGRMVLTGSEDQTCRLWETGTGMPVGPPLPHQGASGRWPSVLTAGSILTCSPDGTAKLWRVTPARDDEPVPRAPRRGASIRLQPGRPDGGDRRRGPEGPNVESGSSTDSPDKVFDHPDAVEAVAFSPDGTAVLTGCRDGKARLWKAATGERFGPVFDYRSADLCGRFQPRWPQGPHRRLERFRPSLGRLNG